MKAKLSCVPKVNGLFESKHFLVTIFVVTIAITLSNYLLLKEKNQN
jgi:hypothetical protein